MFQKTKIRLVSLYTLVFFCIVSSLSVSLYLYMYHNSFSSIDEKLSNTANKIVKYNGKETHEEKEHEIERKILLLYWGKSKELIQIFPQDVYLRRDISDMYQQNLYKKWRTQHFDGHTYRILTVNTHDMILKNKPVNNLQLVLNIDPEVHFLDELLIIIGFGSACGLIVSFFVGLFLANKALIPIQQSWKKQSQFVADASHELRTPLTVIQTHLELLFRHPTNTIEQESVTIFKSLSEVKRVNKLVEDLLTLARTDSNEQLINPQLFSLSELLQLIVEQFEPIAKMKELILEENIDQHIDYFGDKERLHQLFVILLDNALKFTPPGGRVSIFCKREGSSINIIIKDTGIGIRVDDLPHIFDRFYMSNKARTRSAGGTGLGLSIAKWIVNAHFGQINVESKLKEGTRFTIKIPIKESLK